ncbi:MAG: hypothetical protein HOQ12_12550, partial [Gemmatimonadaceae bacterium]|nr:hypothetical protein [Gemmatimonadaceae bacterium]
VGAAQEGRLFKDSWFFGAKAGNMTYWTTTTSHGQAPMLGGETLITRSRGGLYISLDQAFFDGTTTVIDGAGAQRIVDIKDNRRATVAAMIFPKAFGWIRPYGGIGFAMNFMQQATARGGADATTQQIIDEQKTASAPIFIIGTQLQLLRFSVFGQGSYMPAQNSSLFNNNETYFVEAGIRYNIGSSIERIGR